MSNKNVFPLASEDERDGGWTYSIDFIKEVISEAEMHGASDLQLEDVEGILTAVALYVRLAKTT